MISRTQRTAMAAVAMVTSALALGADNRASFVLDPTALQVCQIERRAGELLGFREKIRELTDAREHAFARDPSFQSLFRFPHQPPFTERGRADRKARSEKLARAAEALDAALDMPIPVDPAARARHVERLLTLLGELEAAMQEPLKNRLREVYGESDAEALLASGGAECVDPTRETVVLASRTARSLESAAQTVGSVVQGFEVSNRDAAFVAWCQARREARAPSPNAEELWAQMHPPKKKPAASDENSAAKGKPKAPDKSGDKSEEPSTDALLTALRERGVKFVMGTPRANRSDSKVPQDPSESKTPALRAATPPQTSTRIEAKREAGAPNASSGQAPSPTAPFAPSLAPNPQSLRCEAKPAGAPSGAQAADVSEKDCGLQTEAQKQEAEKKEALEILLAVRDKPDRFTETPLLPNQKLDLAKEVAAPQRELLPLPSAQSLTERGLQALDHYKKSKSLPDDWQWGTFFIDAETIARKETSAEGYTDATEQFHKDMEKYAKRFEAHALKESTPVQSLIADLFSDYLKHYSPKGAELRSFLEKGEGNERAQTRMVISAFQATGVPLPSYLRLGVEINTKDKSLQPVLVHKETGEVTQLITGKKQQKGRVYDPAYLLNEELLAVGAQTEMKAPDFLIQDLPKPKGKPDAVAKKSPEEKKKLTDAIAAALEKEAAKEGKKESKDDAKPKKEKTLETPQVDTSGSFMDRLKAISKILSFLGDAIQSIFKSNITTGELVEALGEILKRVPDLGKLIGQIDLGDGSKLDLSGFSTEDLAEMDWDKFLTPERKAEFLKRLKAGEYDEQLRAGLEQAGSRADLKQVKEQLESRVNSKDGAELFKAALKGDTEIKSEDPLQRLSVSKSEDIRAALGALAQAGRGPGLYQLGKNRMEYSRWGAPGKIHHLSLDGRKSFKKWMETSEGKQALSRFNPLMRSEITRRILSDQVSDLYSSEAMDFRSYPYDSSNFGENLRKRGHRMSVRTPVHGAVFFDHQVLEQYQSLRTESEKFEFLLDEMYQNLRKDLQALIREEELITDRPDLLLDSQLKTKPASHAIEGLFRSSVSEVNEGVAEFSATRELLYSPLQRNDYTQDMNEYRFQRMAGERASELKGGKAVAWNNRFKLSGLSTYYGPEPVFRDLAQRELVERVPEIRALIKKREALFERLHKNPEGFSKLAARMSHMQLRDYLQRTSRFAQDLVMIKTSAAVPLVQKAEVGYRNSWFEDWMSNLGPENARVKVDPQGQKAQEEKREQEDRDPQGGSKARPSNRKPLLPDRFLQLVRERKNQSSQARVQFQLPQDAIPPRMGVTEGIPGAEQAAKKAIELPPLNYMELISQGFRDAPPAEEYAVPSSKLDPLLQLWTPDVTRWVLKNHYAFPFENPYQSEEKYYAFLARLSALRPTTDRKIKVGEQLISVDLLMLSISGKNGPAFFNQYLGIPHEFPFSLVDESLRKERYSPMTLKVVQALRDQSGFESIEHWVTSKTAEQRAKEVLGVPAIETTVNGRQYRLRGDSPEFWPEEVKRAFIRAGLVTHDGKSFRATPGEPAKGVKPPPIFLHLPAAVIDSGH